MDIQYKYSGRKDGSRHMKIWDVIPWRMWKLSKSYNILWKCLQDMQKRWKREVINGKHLQQKLLLENKGKLKMSSEHWTGTTRGPRSDHARFKSGRKRKGENRLDQSENGGPATPKVHTVPERTGQSYKKAPSEGHRISRSPLKHTTAHLRDGWTAENARCGQAGCGASAQLWSTAKTVKPWVWAAILAYPSRVFPARWQILVLVNVNKCQFI